MVHPMDRLHAMEIDVRVVDSASFFAFGPQPDIQPTSIGLNNRETLNTTG